MADEEVREAEDQLARANIGGHKNGGPGDTDSEDTSETDESPESNDDENNPGSSSSLNWDIFDVKLIFLNGGGGEGKADARGDLNEIVRSIIENQKNITALAVLENGGIASDIARQKASGTIAHWGCESFYFGNNSSNGISIYYDQRKIIGPEFDRQPDGHYFHMKATIKSSGTSSTVISVTLFQGTHTENGSGTPYVRLKDHWNKVKRGTDLAVVIGGFNLLPKELRSKGITGFLAFKPGSLNKGATHECRDNALSNITRYKKSTLDDAGKPNHQVRIVRYRWVQKRQPLQGKP